MRRIGLNIEQYNFMSLLTEWTEINMIVKEKHYTSYSNYISKGQRGLINRTKIKYSVSNRCIVQCKP